MAKEYSEEIQTLLKTVCDYFEREDREVRERQIRTWKRMKYLWDGLVHTWWDETAHDWRIYEFQQRDNDASFYDKPINVYRALLESIIAALSVTVPTIKCTPDDADNPLDITTAKAGDIICELVYKHNDVMLVWLQALFIYCTEGLIAAYTYTDEDEAYGTYEEDKYDEVEVEQEVCPLCQQNLVNEETYEELDNEFKPDEENPIRELEQDGLKLCDSCQSLVVPQISKLKVPRLVGKTNKPKARQCIEVYGGLYIKIAQYAKKQADTPYLIFSYETHFTNILERYPDLRGKISRQSANSGTSNSGWDTYGQLGRLSTQYRGDQSFDTPTVRNVWLRPSAFNYLSEENEKLLKKEFPDGCLVTFANEHFAEACPEKLDDCWTLTHNPLSDYLYHDPLGMLLQSVQEITNNIISLVLQTIEHGINQTFADPNTLNFEQYEKTEATPGMIYPAKAPSGRSLGEGFYELKTATLSGEIQPFMQKIEELGQMVSGALPSLFGGAQPNSSKTAAQYSMSRAQAQQRLQNIWKMLTVWWQKIFGKVIPAYIKCVQEDEKLVKRANGGYVNVFVRKADLQGKIGDIELEASEQLPITWAQQKDIIMQLLQAANPIVMQALASPENLPYIVQAIGLTQFKVPGMDDRTKQYEEIKILVDSVPLPTMDEQTGQQVMTPSVDIEPMVDDNAIHAAICKNWAVSEAGRLAKIENPEGYQNVLLHMERHVKVEQVMAQMNAAPQPIPGEEKPVAAQVKQRGQPA